MFKVAEDIDNLFEKLLDSKPQLERGNYQIPVKVGKSGNSIESGDKPWIVGTFLPGQFVNERHPQGHNGVDLKAPRGTPIYPIGPGIAAQIKEYPKGGKTCKVLHENGQVVSYYAHMDSVNVTENQPVELGTVIGTVGDTGNAKGSPHLHFEVSANGKKIDPMSIIGKPIGSFSSKNLSSNINKDITSLVDQLKPTE